MWESLAHLKDNIKTDLREIRHEDMNYLKCLKIRSNVIISEHCDENSSFITVGNFSVT
jgi:hypothetical protein